MKVQELLRALNISEAVKDFDVLGLTKDSREVKRGFVFFATSNDVQDGHQFINSAASNGAALVIAEKKDKTANVPQIIVSDGALALAEASQCFYEYPARQMTLIGITGTNGKTTSTYLIESILAEANKKTGVIGTINYRYANKVIDASNTTPVSYFLQQVLKEMKDNKTSHVISEISSHALKLKRVEGLDIDIALFTNLTQDHLDFHKDFEDYYKSKKLLFSGLLKNSCKNNKVALINIDDTYGLRLYKELCEEHKGDFLTLSMSMLNPSADFYTEDLNVSLTGSTFNIIFKKNKLNIVTPLIGFHNVMNVIGSVSAALSLGIENNVIIKSIKNQKTVPGRLDKIDTKTNKHIFVDYAHTPAALENVLSALKKVSTSKIITVFGCGGDRDRTKRPLMGEIAARYSDKVVVTSDNPRTEEPESIIDEIIPGLEKHTFSYIRESNREKAIKKSLELAGENDIVLIAGKGHEDYQIIGKTKIHFSDKEIAERYIK